MTLRYDDEGEGRPIVFSSGFQAQSAHFVWQRDALVEAGYRVIRYDHRCPGRSDFPEHGQRMSRLALDLGELLTALDLRDVVLVGHSICANVSLAYFSIAPDPWDRVAAFVAVDQSPKIVNNQEWQWGVRGINEQNVFDAAHFRCNWFDNGLEPQKLILYPRSAWTCGNFVSPAGIRDQWEWLFTSDGGDYNGRGLVPGCPGDQPFFGS